MAPEVQIFFTVFLLALFFSFMAVRYFLRQAKRNGGDRVLALRNGLLLALALFAVFIMAYDAIKPERVVQNNEPDWCERNPGQCVAPPPVSAIR